MSTKKELKIEKVLDVTQAAEFFHILGMAIAMADEGRLAKFGLLLGDFEKIKLTLTKKGEVFILKAKVKEGPGVPLDGATPGTVGHETDLGAEQGDDLSYKSLKKRMKGSFAELKKLLTQDVPPSADTVRRFLNDSSRMLSFPGMGDEHYESYQRCCMEFERACAGGDLEAMRTTLAAVEARKKACHAQYK
jgi:XXXCH domain-containing protein